MTARDDATSNEKDEAREAYNHALETARKILIILHHEDPAIQMGASMMAALVLYQTFVSVHDSDGWMESADSAWDHRDEIAFDLFGKPVTPITH
ncbi:MAG: hypothetical protein EB015_15355 [Methylocystaceae bacterium]|nr:hypothetical protein [Methylocystaceae bacterium]